eukprot:TRINITY_DN8242_c0_g1_i1.p1 TRINITY_DN8242_c0_g1~~TRINITY_DN8242_c0_g1_i1.p1  ORF type:complete len:461 (+),score=106.91 TRINITY_DN8242_c0_g1_i1:486-1868(+)
MSRPVRPRPVDINKKLPIIRSCKDLEDDESTGTRASQLARLALENENEASSSSTGKKSNNEIPTPQFVVVDSYERDYSRTFIQPSSYVRGKVRAENSDYVEYDLDDEDEDWLQDFNKEKRVLSPERFESMLYKLEIMDHKARERAVGSGATAAGPNVAVQLQFDPAVEFLQSQCSRQFVPQAVYNYWKEKRERWQKPILRRLQPPPPVNDTNPYNVFRPREKAHRLHTRRMQRRENSVQSFEKLRQVRRNLAQAKVLLKAMVKREEKKKELVESDIQLQRVQIKLKHETQHEDDTFMFPGLSVSHKFPLPKQSEDGRANLQLGNSLGVANGHSRIRPGLFHSEPVTDAILLPERADLARHELRRNLEQQREQLHKRDPHEAELLFTKPLDPEKLPTFGIVVPPEPVSPESGMPLYRSRPRMGRGGRIVFDRWNPLEETPIGFEKTTPLPEGPQQLSRAIS